MQNPYHVSFYICNIVTLDNCQKQLSVSLKNCVKCPNERLNCKPNNSSFSLAVPVFRRILKGHDFTIYDIAE